MSDRRPPRALCPRAWHDEEGASDHADVSRKTSSGVICLFSALRFHDPATKNPFEVWVAMAPKQHVPRIETVALRVLSSSGEALAKGVEPHDVAGVPVRIYGVAKTVADCFSIGTDVAIAALRECLKQKSASVDDVLRYARICRVERVVSPFLKAML